MLWYIIKKEISEYMKSLYFMLACLICMVLIPLVIFLSLQDYKERLVNYSESLIQDDLYSGLVVRINWENGTSEVRSKSVPKGGIPKKPTKLSILAMGLENEMSGPTHIKERWREIIQGKRQSRNPLKTLFQTPDFLYVVKVALSLLALLFAFDAVNGEKSRGTLRLIFSNRVPSDTLLLGKIIGRLSMLYVPFILGTSVGFLLIILSPIVQITVNDLVRISIIVLISMLYILVFFLLGLLLSSLTQKPSLSLVMSLFVWIAPVVLIPSFTLMLAKGIQPVPSNASVAAQRYNRGVAIVTEAQRMDSRGSYRDHIPYHNEKEYEITTELMKMDQDHYINQVQFYNLVKSIGRISPVFSFVQVITGLTRTSIDDYLHYRQHWFDLRSHRLKYQYASVGGMIDFLDGKSARINGRLIAEKLCIKYRKKYTDWKQYFKQEMKKGRATLHTKYEIDPLGPIPDFSFKERYLEDAIKSSMWDITLLMFCSVLFFVLTYISFQRYDVR